MNETRKFLFSAIFALLISLVVTVSFTYAQNGGEWSGTTDEGNNVYFVVSDNTVKPFLIEICVYGGTGSFGGCFEQYVDLSLPISGDSFGFSNGLFTLTGHFTSSTTANGTWNYIDGYLGSGNGTWSAGFPASPRIALNLSIQSFGEQLVGSTGNVFSFTLYNKGGGTATGSVSLTGPNKDEFEIISGGGSFSISHDQIKEIKIRFSPTSKGLKTATLLADGVSPVNDISASLSGTGTYPTLAVNPTSRSVTASSGTTTFFVYNSGPGNISWTAEKNTADTWMTISSGSSGVNGGTLTVQYDANYGKARTGSITVTADDADNSPLTIELHQDEGSPHIVLMPSARDFGGQVIGSASDVVAFTLSNAEGGTATGSISLTGTDADQFEITSGGGSFSLTHGQTKDIFVRFTPASEGLKTATLLADGDTPCNDTTTSLQGTGRFALLSVTPLFHNAPSAGGSVTFNVTNAGTGSMPWIAKRYLADTWITIASGSSGTNSGTITVNYTTNYGNARTGSLVVTAENAANSPLVIEVRQAAGTPHIVLTPLTQNFGRQEVGVATEATTFILRNTEGGTATGSVLLSGLNSFQFEIISGGGSFSLEHNQSKEISVRFAPVSAGEKTATLMVQGDSPANDVSASLSGIGTPSESKLTASDGAVYDNFGLSVSISGDYAIIGAYQDDDSGSNSGAAYVFERAGNDWIQRAKLTAGDAAAGKNFGYSVSMSGDYAIVGAIGDGDNGSFSGCAYIYRKPLDGWADMTETAKLTASDGADSDNLGFSVGISGDYAIVGALTDDDNGSSSGSAYVYTKPLGGWTNMTETAKLTASDGAAGDNFGISVSISDEYALAGAYQDDDNGSNSGSAYVFEKPLSGWLSMTETAKLTASNAASYAFFGGSVHTSGDYAIVGAFQSYYNETYLGAAYIFKKPTAGWVNTTETAMLTASDGESNDGFGYSVSLSGDYAIVGANGDDDFGSNSGSAYIFKRSGEDWLDMTETTKLTAGDAASGDTFGYSVSISGGHAIVGAYRDDDKGSDSGSAYIYATGNLPPIVSDITDLVTNQNTPTDALSFTVTDPETSSEYLIITGLSSNTSLLPNENIVFGGTGENRTITLTPATNKIGTSTVTVTVSDGNQTGQDTFSLTVLGQDGDITGDGTINLEDVITALKILAGKAPDSISITGDVNHDGKIGMEEVLFDLHYIKEEK